MDGGSIVDVCVLMHDGNGRAFVSLNQTGSRHNLYVSDLVLVDASDVGLLAREVNLKDACVGSTATAVGSPINE